LDINLERPHCSTKPGLATQADVGTLYSYLPTARILTDIEIFQFILEISRCEIVFLVSR